MGPTETEMTLLSQGRHPTQVTLFALCQPLCSLHLTKFCSKNTHPNQNILWPLSQLTVPSIIPTARPSLALHEAPLCFPNSPSPASGPLHLLFLLPVLYVFGSFSSFICHLQSYLCELKETHIPQVTLLSHHFLTFFTRFIVTWSCLGPLLVDVFLNSVCS